MQEAASLQQTSVAQAGPTPQPSGMPAVSLPELKARLLQLNNNVELPFKVREESDLLIAAWNIVDAKWLEFFAKAGMKEQFEVRLQFNEANHTVSYIEKMYTVNWKAGLPTLSASASVFYGKQVGFRKGGAFGIKDDLSLGQIYSFDFSTNKITGPLFDTIRQAGWRVSDNILGNAMQQMQKASPLKVVFVAALIMVVIVVVGLGGYYLIQSTSVVKDAAVAEIELLQSGNVSQAFSHSSEEFQQTIGQSELSSFTSNFDLDQMKKVSFNSVSISNNTLAKLSGTLEYRDGHSADIEMEMVKEGEEWKMLSIYVSQK